MHTQFNAKSIKQAFLSAIAISVIALPLVASAGDKSSGVFYNEQNLDNGTDQEILYAKLQDKSREICGSSNLKVTGSIERVSANEECYQGTLTAAVERLNNSDVTELHQQES